MSVKSSENGTTNLEDWIDGLDGLDWKNMWCGGKPDYVDGHNLKRIVSDQMMLDGDFLNFPIYSSYGHVVLDKVNYYYDDYLHNPNTCADAFNALRKVYKEWVSTDTYIHLELIREGYDLLNMKPIDYSEGDLLVKSAKRGNTIYRDRVKTRLEPIYSVSKDISRNKDRNTMTNSMFVTLTCDTKLYDTFADAWEGIAKDWNKFITNVRNNHGDVSYFRIFEASKRNYPHIHAILIFKDKDFPIFQHKGRTRVNPKGIFDDFWHSNVDVEGIRNMDGAIRYIAKYITKDMDAMGNTDTLALMWFFRKRSYAISKSFCDLIHPFLHNSKVAYQYRLEFSIRYEYQGQILAEYIGRYENYIFADEKLSRRCRDWHDMFNPFNEYLRARYHAMLEN